MIEPISIIKILFIFSIQISLFLIIKKLDFQRFFSKYDSVQKIHQGEVLRVGGLIYFIGLISLYFFIDKKFFYLNSIFLCSSLLFIFTFIEDVKHILSAKIRLIILFLVSTLFVTTNQLPEISILSFIINSENIFFYQGLFILSLLALMNGFNFIDGLNGLSSFNFIAILLAMSFIASWSGDKEIFNLTLSLIFISFVFGIINFPFGLIFLGDSGSYLYAFLSGSLTIILFERNPELPTTLATILLAYPITEVVFSFFRKVVNKKSPMKPDVKHLHHLVLMKFGREDNRNNNLASIMMFPFWLTPLILVLLSHYYFLNNVFLYFCYLVFYIFSYYALKSNFFFKNLYKNS